MSDDQTSYDALNQLQEIKSEIINIKGLSRFNIQLTINDAKSRGVNHIDEILKKFGETKAKIYLLVDGFSSSVKIAKSVNVTQSVVHKHLESLIKEDLIDRDNPGSSKATYRKSGVEDVIRLSSLLKKKFNLSKWMDDMKRQNV